MRRGAGREWEAVPVGPVAPGAQGGLTSLRCLVAGGTARQEVSGATANSTVCTKGSSSSSSSSSSRSSSSKEVSSCCKEMSRSSGRTKLEARSAGERRSNGWRVQGLWRAGGGLAGRVHWSR